MWWDKYWEKVDAGSRCYRKTVGPARIADWEICCCSCKSEDNLSLPILYDCSIPYNFWDVGKTEWELQVLTLC